MSALKKKTVYSSVIALAAFALVFVCIGCAQRLGVGLADEQFYYTVVKRLLEGDRLFVDEWHPSQMFSVILLLPCRLYLRVFGSIAGLILAMRRLDFVYELFFGGFVYYKLRKYGLPALFFTLAVCVFFPYYTFTYYTFGVNGLVLILAALADPEKPPRGFGLMLLGAVAALTVMAQPFLAVGYFAYSAQVLVLYLRKRRGLARAHRAAAAPTLRVWAYLTAGIFPVFAVFIGWLFYSYGMSFTPLIRGIPELFTGLEYTFDTGYRYNSFFRIWYKLFSMAGFFGYVPILLMAAAAAALVTVRLVKPALLRKRGVRLAAFILLCVCLTASYLYVAHAVYVQRSYREFTVDNIGLHGIFLPVLLFAAGGLALVKDPPKLCFAFLQTGCAASLLVDFSSANCICYGGVLTLLPATLCFCSLAREFLRLPGAPDGAKPEKRASAVLRRIPVCAAALLAAACVLFWSGKTFVQCALVPAAGFVKTEGAAGTALKEMESGPFAGLYVSAAVKELCDATGRDMEALRGKGNLYVDSLCPVAYLYAENRMGIYSSFWVEEDLPARMLRFWELHPEKTPAVIYVPYYEFMTAGYYDRLAVKGLWSSGGSAAGNGPGSRMFYDIRAKQGQAERLTAYFDCEITRGEAGFIIYVNS